jgi:hypothetical protein
MLIEHETAKLQELEESFLRSCVQCLKRIFKY